MTLASRRINTESKRMAGRVREAVKNGAVLTVYDEDGKLVEHVVGAIDIFAPSQRGGIARVCEVSPFPEEAHHFHLQSVEAWFEYREQDGSLSKSLGWINLDGWEFILNPIEDEDGFPELFAAWQEACKKDPALMERELAFMLREYGLMESDRL
jgi:hypothetical protein